MNFKLIKKNEFDLIIKFLSLNFSSPTHWPEWNILVSKFYNTKFYYFGLFESNQLKGICPVHETKAGFLRNLNSGRYHFIPNGGWILNTEKQINLSKIPIPSNARFECFALPAIKEFGVTYSPIQKSFYTLLVDLRMEEEKIWSASINSKRRNMIRKSHKMGIIVTKDARNIDDFYFLYSDTNKSNGLNYLPKYFFVELISNAVNINFIPFVALYDGKPCGALGLIYDKNYAFYWIGASKKNSQNFGQGELLQWEAIQHSRNHGCKYYDLCYIEKERLPSIFEFKKGFSNDLITVPYLLKKHIIFKILNKFRI
ncbi:MAG: GNAT family N-acetyltransferase [Bacteroidales bacterium]|nr:GNAT family N-acetyltransferase [Bacteroidales bacterium]